MLKIKRRIIAQHKRPVRITEVLIIGNSATIRMNIEDRMAAQGRREVALSFFRQMRPWLYYFSAISLRHPGQIDPARTEKYSTWIYNSKPIFIEEQHFALEVKLNRLALGWNQTRLAQVASVSRARLSEIESLKRRASPRTQQKLIQALRYGYAAEIKHPRRVAKGENKIGSLGHGTNNGSAKDSSDQWRTQSVGR